MSTKIQKSAQIGDKVLEKVHALSKAGKLQIPVNYSPENAIKTAILQLQETYTKDRKPVLDACSQTSIANALLKMVINGWNPALQQCYFIAYGNKLSCQSSYFGKMLAARRSGVISINANIIRKGDIIKTKTTQYGNIIIEQHEQKFENLDNEILGAYAIAVIRDLPEPLNIRTEIMTMKQIKQAWLQSQSKELSVHNKFPEEMAKRTVINRLLKNIVNTSFDEVNNVITDADDDITDGDIEAIEAIEIDDIEEIEEPETEGKKEKEGQEAKKSGANKQQSNIIEDEPEF